MTNKQRVIEFLNNWKGENPPTYKQCAISLGLTTKQVCSVVQQCELHNKFWKDYNVKIDVEAHSGEVEMRQPTKAELSAFRQHCENNNLPFDLWRSFWHKTGDYSSFFVNGEAAEADKKAQEEFLKRITKSAPKTKKSPLPSKTLAIPSNYDVHIGKHCEAIRTGNDYTPDIAIKQVLQGNQDLMEKTKPFGVTDILLPLGNDIVHVDSNRYQSTAGTPQDSYGSVEGQMFLAAELYIKMIEQFAENHNVWLCHVHSNHDRVSGWSVSQMVARYFTNHPRVKAHSDSLNQVPMKYFIFGDTLIVFTHGEIKEEKLLGIVKYEVGAAFAQVQHIVVYQGHIHHKTVSKRGVNTQKDVEKDHTGATIIKAGNGAKNLMHVETVRSPSPADNWHKNAGYNNFPAVELFLHDTHSQFARFTHYFN